MASSLTLKPGPSCARFEIFAHHFLTHRAFWGLFPKIGPGQPVLVQNEGKLRSLEQCCATAELLACPLHTMQTSELLANAEGPATAKGTPATFKRKTSRQHVARAPAFPSRPSVVEPSFGLYLVFDTKLRGYTLSWNPAAQFGFWNLFSQNVIMFSQNLSESNYDKTATKDT